MRPPTTEPTNPFTLYPEPGQTLDKKQIADAIGVSRMRAAQITGTKTNPNPELGEPQKIEGVRGMRWPSESVYRYVLRTGRDACNIPPLVPHPDKARYELDKGRSEVYDLNASNQAMILVFTEQVESSDPYTIYLGWPLTSSSLDSRELREFCISSSVLRALATDRSVFVTFRLPNPGMSAAYVASEYTLGNQQGQWRPTSPLHDFYPNLLACIGLTALPMWRAGDMNEVDAQQWINQGCNAPVSAAAPAPVKDLYMLYKYVLTKAMSESDSLLAHSWAVMACDIYYLHLERWQNAYSPTWAKTLRYFQWALDFTDLQAPPQTELPGPGLGAALEALVESDTYSPFAQIALDHFGDLSYQAPATFSLETLPATWREGIKRWVDVCVTPSAHAVRFQRLVTTHYYHASVSANPQGGKFAAGYLLTTDTHYTTMPALGNTDENNSIVEGLRKLWPADALEVLVQRNERGQLAAWVRTPAGIYPLPTSYKNAPHPLSAFVALTAPSGEQVRELLIRAEAPNADAARVIADIPAGEYKVFDAESFVAAFA